MTLKEITPVNDWKLEGKRFCFIKIEGRLVYCILFASSVQSEGNKESLLLKESESRFQ